MVTRVLLATDQAEAASRIRHALEAENMTVLNASNADRVLALLDSHELDLMILQHDLPGMPGSDLARICRQRTGALVLLVDLRNTAMAGRGKRTCEEANHHLEADLDMGARIGALRMIDVRSEAPGRSDDDRFGQCLVSGDLTLYLERYAATIGERYVPLTPVEAQILRVLIEHSPRVVPQELLIARVWPDGDGDLSSLAAGLNSLRTALGDDPVNPSRLTHVEGYGFRISPPRE